MNQQPFTMREEACRQRLLFACRESGLGEICIIESSISDPHNGGQSAAVFESDGKKYVYKPRSAKTDIAWADFIDEMDRVLGVPLPRAVRPVCAGEEYTIVPFVEECEARDEGEVRAYYEKCGVLLALAMVLGMTDMHSENLVADGDAPCLVDLETVLSGITPDKAVWVGNLYDSILFSHLLPNWMLADGENRDVGALTASGKNQPRLENEPCPAYRYAEEICAGFRSAFERICAHRDEVDRALQRFSDVPFRKLLRPTAAYDRLCRRIAALDDEKEKRAAAERLRRAYILGGAAWAEQMERACLSEMEAVLRGDIPYFFGLGGERHLRDRDGVVAENYFALSPVESARMRLRALSPQDGVDQERIIRQSLRATCPDVERMRFWSALEVFEYLEGQAVKSCPCSWLGLTTDAGGQAYFQSVGFDLYRGLMGVLCFYAALYEATGDERVRRALLSRYAPYRRMYIEQGRPLKADCINVNLTDGVGGHIMALSFMARCLGDSAFLEDAVRLLRRFDFEGFDADSGWDVYGGAGGLLVSLPCLMGCGADEEIRVLARTLAQGISQIQPELTGLAHGAAGLALALSAAQYVGAGQYDAEILRLLQWENAQFDEEEVNWPDYRDPDRRGFMKGFCSGAPGIGLARKQMLEYTGNRQIRRICEKDVLRARIFLKNQIAPLRRDSLCCGNAAMIEAERSLTGCMAGNRLNDAPVLVHMLDTDDVPVGLFQGWAGVGYALVRQMEASKSSLFVWEVDR